MLVYVKMGGFENVYVCVIVCGYFDRNKNGTRNIRADVLCSIKNIIFFFLTHFIHIIYRGQQLGISMKIAFWRKPTLLHIRQKKKKKITETSFWFFSLHHHFLFRCCVKYDWHFNEFFFSSTASSYSSISLF